MSVITPIQFLTTLYPEPLGPGQILMWSKSRRDGKELSHWIDNLDGAARKADRLQKSHDVYFSVALHDQARALGIAKQRSKHRTKRHIRGSTGSATLLPAIWADLDVAGPGRGNRRLPPDRAALLGLLAAMELQPSILIDSGGGLHAYWLFDRALVLAEPADRRRARDLIGRIQGALDRGAREHGWMLDNSSDLGHMLRLPGTLNHKLKPSREVMVVQFPPLVPGIEHFRYRPRQFAAVAKASAPDHLERLLRVAIDLLYDGPLGIFPLMYTGCSWLRYCYENRTSLTLAEWLALMTIIGRCTADTVDGRRLLHRMSRDHPGYDPKITDEQLDYALATWGPRPCTYMSGELGAHNAHCANCDHFARQSSPIALGCASLSGAPLVQLGPGPGGPQPGAPQPGTPQPGAPQPGAPPQLAEDPPAAEPSARGGERPRIVITAREDEVNDQALASLVRRERNLFQRGGALVHVVHTDGRPLKMAPAKASQTPPGSPVISPVRQAHLRQLLARHCVFLRPAPDSAPRQVQPPRRTVRALHGRGVWPGLPQLRELVESSVLPGGTVVQQPHFDQATGLMYLPTVASGPVLPDLVNGLAELLASLGGAATSGELLAELAARGEGSHGPLRRTLAGLCPPGTPGTLPTAAELGRGLVALRGRVVGDAWIERGPRTNKGFRWSVRNAGESA